MGEGTFRNTIDAGFGDKLSPAGVQSLHKKITADELFASGQGIVEHEVHGYTRL